LEKHRTICKSTISFISRLAPDRKYRRIPDQRRGRTSGGCLATVEVALERETPSHLTPQASALTSASPQKEFSTIDRPANGLRSANPSPYTSKGPPVGAKITTDHPLHPDVPYTAKSSSKHRETHYAYSHSKSHRK